MALKIICLLICAIVSINCHPTMYKMNQVTKVLEAELFPVSSTVIPLPIYQVSSGFNVAPNKNDHKGMKPVGPITLITSDLLDKIYTSHVGKGVLPTRENDLTQWLNYLKKVTINNKKKTYPKIKLDDVSVIKQINKKEFEN